MPHFLTQAKSFQFVREMGIFIFRFCNAAETLNNELFLTRCSDNTVSRTFSFIPMK